MKALYLAVLMIVVACSGPSPTPTFVGTSTPVSSPTPFVDTTSLPSLVIAPIPLSLLSYDRDDWRHWIDADGDCQNARHEVLIEEFVAPVTFANSQECTVATGLWEAPFTGFDILLAGDLDVDHMVPLANAHRSGGRAWDDEKKKAFANELSYPGHLVAVTASASRSKGARGPDEWRPRDEAYWCQYAVDWITIKFTWELAATATEWEALLEMLGTCPEDVTIEGGGITTEIAPTATSPAWPPSIESGREVGYDPFGPDRNCGDFDNWQEAQRFYEAAGGPTTNRHRLDADRDGIACESLPGAP